MTEQITGAIDVHAHYGDYFDSPFGLNNWLMSGDPDEVVRRASAVGIAQTIVSPLKAMMPRYHADTEAGNREAARVVRDTEELLQWVVVDPLNPATFKQASQMLRSPKCVGIKVHPEMFGFKIADQGEAIFEFAAERMAVVQSHSGGENSMPADFVRFANDYPDVKLILSHLGNGPQADHTLQVNAVKAAKHGNIYTDTSSSNSITSRMLEWAVMEIGAEKILFGSDTPLYFVAMQKARIDHADLSESDKCKILRENAIRLFGLP